MKYLSSNFSSVNRILKLCLFIFFIPSIASAQFNEIEAKKADSYIQNFLSHIDSLKVLSSDEKIYYCSDSLFKSMHLVLNSGKTITLDIKLKDNYRGWVELGVEFTNYILFQVRYQGSCNPIYLYTINKVTGEKLRMGKYPFYIDSLNEIVVFEATFEEDKDLVLYDFKDNLKETFLLPPNTNYCLCGNCWELIELTKSSLKVGYYDEQNLLKHIEILRL